MALPSHCWAERSAKKSFGFFGERPFDALLIGQNNRRPIINGQDRRSRMMGNEHASAIPSRTRE
jgi:hypothetical protein